MGCSLGIHLNPKWSMRTCGSNSHPHKTHWQVLKQERVWVCWPYSRDDGRALGSHFNELLMAIIPHCTVAKWEKQWGTNLNRLRISLGRCDLKGRGNRWELSTDKFKMLQAQTGLGTKCWVKTLMLMNDFETCYFKMLWCNIQIIHFVCLLLAPNPFSHSDLSFCL